MWAILRQRAGVSNGRPLDPERVWLHWLVLAGVLAFASFVLGVRGIWAQLNQADPTGVTQLIVVVFYVASLWCGFRSHTLMQQSRAGLAAIQGTPNASGWVAHYLQSAEHSIDPAPLMDVLGERAHGPQETAWWINGLLLKLGLLGTVVGFILMAFQVGSVGTFDLTQAQSLLKNMTNGMGVALLTTLVGLVGNIILGWQLLNLDRAADALLATAQEAATLRRVRAA